MAKALPFGTQVKVIKEGYSNNYHGFKVGTLATAQEELFEANPTWQRFKDEEGMVQYLQDQHFQLVTPKAVEDHQKDEEKLLDITLPNKVVYAIVDKDDEIIGCRVDRDKARDTKALLGGKKKGVRIFQYAAVKEIR